MAWKKRAQEEHSALFLALAMIVFSAIIGVFVASSQIKWRNDAQAAGKAVVDKFGTSLIVAELYAQKSSPRELEYFQETLKLNYGSYDVKVSDMGVVFNTRNATRVYEYEPTIDCSVNPAVDSGPASVSNETNTNKFGMLEKLNSNYNDKYTGYITRFNMVRICYIAPEPLSEDEPIKITVIPRDGTPLVTEVTLPSIFKTDFIQIYPIVHIG